MKIPSKILERKLSESGYGIVCGVDEVGIGCLAGPVVVCAVRISPEFYKTPQTGLRGVLDSKLLTVQQRERFNKELLTNSHVSFAISLVSVKTIDEINIYQASRRAMRKAINRVIKNSSSQEPQKVVILVDGNKKIAKILHDQQAIIKGDQKIFTIACASIIAKVYRDKFMARAAKRYPGYGLEKHKGYATKDHYTQLAKLGPSPIHRRSFRLSG